MKRFLHITAPVPLVHHHPCTLQGLVGIRDKAIFPRLPSSAGARHRQTGHLVQMQAQRVSAVVRLPGDDVKMQIAIGWEVAGNLHFS